MKNKLYFSIFCSLYLITIFGCVEIKENQFTSSSPIVPTNHPTQEMIDRFNTTEPKEGEDGSLWDRLWQDDSLASGDSNNFNNINNTNNINNVNQDETTHSSENADQVVLEADIIHKDGNLLIVLSKITGIYTIEINDASQLEILDHKQIPGRPFEMTIRNDRAYVTATHTTGEENSNSQEVIVHSKIIEFDLSNPETITKESQLSIDGKITDTRMLGNFLYVVTTKNSYYGQSFTIFSVDLTPGEKPAIVTSHEKTSDLIGDTPVIYSTNEHLYLAVTASESWEYTAPTYYDLIYKFNISSIDGRLDFVNQNNSAGPIFARWQMSEQHGVFRIITQPTFDLPILQQYTVSEDAFDSLNNLTITVPYEEVLKSVRYDGTRGYLITALYETRMEGEIEEHIVIADPLYILDLTNPNAPTQHGSLEMPGFVHFMQVNGSTMVGLSVNEDGESLSIALIDVSDIDNPSLTDRINMPGNFNQLAEDFDRIHKALTIDWERGLILMPFAQNIFESESGPNILTQFSGVQMFNFTPTSISAGVTLPHLGFARRSIIVDDETIITMGDQWIGMFDISSFSHPALLSNVILSHPSYHMALTEDDKLIYLVQTGLGTAPEIHIQPPEFAGLPYPETSFSLDFIGNNSDNPSDIYRKMVPQYVEFYYNQQKAYIAYGINPPIQNPSCKPQSSNFDPKLCAAQQTGLVVVDFAGEHPTLISYNVFDTVFPYIDGYKDRTTFTGHHSGRLISIREDSIFFNHNELIEISQIHTDTPVLSILRENNLTSQFGPMEVSDGIISLPQLEKLSNNRVSFFIEQLQLSNLSEENPSKSIRKNIPGSPVYISPNENIIVTLDYKTETEGRIHPNSCYSTIINRWFDYNSTKCIHLKYILKSLKFDENGDVIILDSVPFTGPVNDVIELDGVVYLITGTTEYTKYLINTNELSIRPSGLLFAYKLYPDGHFEGINTIQTSQYGGRFRAVSNGNIAITFENNSVETFALEGNTLRKTGIGQIPDQPRLVFFKENILYTTHGLNGIYSHPISLLP
jgi:uncharacterized secreted protein with C-terminal beta-propeller domain